MGRNCNWKNPTIKLTAPVKPSENDNGKFFQKVKIFIINKSHTKKHHKDKNLQQINLLQNNSTRKKFRKISNKKSQKEKTSSPKKRACFLGMSSFSWWFFNIYQIISYITKIRTFGSLPDSYFFHGRIFLGISLMEYFSSEIFPIEVSSRLWFWKE